MGRELSRITSEVTLVEDPSEKPTTAGLLQVAGHPCLPSQIEGGLSPLRGRPVEETSQRTLGNGKKAPWVMIRSE